jgi:hypothetical protein
MMSNRVLKAMGAALLASAMAVPAVAQTNSLPIYSFSWSSATGNPNVFVSDKATSYQPFTYANFEYGSLAGAGTERFRVELGYDMNEVNSTGAATGTGAASRLVNDAFWIVVNNSTVPRTGNNLAILYADFRTNEVTAYRYIPEQAGNANSGGGSWRVQSNYLATFQDALQYSVNGTTGVASFNINAAQLNAVFGGTPGTGVGFCGFFGGFGCTLRRSPTSPTMRTARLRRRHTCRMTTTLTRAIRSPLPVAAQRARPRWS